MSIHSSLVAYKGHTKDTPSPENLGFCYRSISMVNKITIESIRVVFRT